MPMSKQPPKRELPDGEDAQTREELSFHRFGMEHAVITEIHGRETSRHSMYYNPEIGFLGMNIVGFSYTARDQPVITKNISHHWTLDEQGSWKTYARIQGPTIEKRAQSVTLHDTACAEQEARQILLPHVNPAQAHITFSTALITPAQQKLADFLHEKEKISAFEFVAAYRALTEADNTLQATKFPARTLEN